jgi:hypothetical protein
MHAGSLLSQLTMGNLEIDKAIGNAMTKAFSKTHPPSPPCVFYPILLTASGSHLINARPARLLVPSYIATRAVYAILLPRIS